MHIPYTLYIISQNFRFGYYFFTFLNYCAKRCIFSYFYPVNSFISTKPRELPLGIIARILLDFVDTFLFCAFSFKKRNKFLISDSLASRTERRLFCLFCHTARFFPHKSDLSYRRYKEILPSGTLLCAC